MAESVSTDILDKAILCLVLGAAFYAAPYVLPGSPMFGPIAKGLRMVAPWPLGIGVLLLGLRFVLRRSAAPSLKASPAAVPATGFQEPVLPERPVPERGERHQDPSPRVQEEAWSGKVFEDIEWRRFEAVCESLFGQAGFETKSQSHGADGGIDIWLYSRNATGPVAVVQCKHWRKAVGVKELREFFGVMASQGLKRGTFATTSGFTRDALEFAKQNGINTHDRESLLLLIAKRTPEQQSALLQVAYEGEYWRPTCASCGTKMVERTPKAGGDKFWGCTNYPKCKGRLQISR